MTSAEDTIGDIAGERESCDQDDHPPEFLGVPGVVGPESFVREERQHRERDNGETGERLDVLLIQPVDESMKFVTQRQDQDDDRA